MLQRTKPTLTLYDEILSNKKQLANWTVRLSASQLHPAREPLQNKKEALLDTPAPRKIQPVPVAHGSVPVKLNTVSPDQSTINRQQAKCEYRWWQMLHFPEIFEIFLGRLLSAVAFNYC